MFHGSGDLKIRQIQKKNKNAEFKILGDAMKKKA